MKRRSIFLYILMPVILQWGISFLLQIASIILIKDVLEHVLEVTTFISIVTIPIAGYMYKKDRKNKELQDIKDVGLADYGKVAVLGIVSCITLNVLITLMNLQRFSPVYQNVTEVIYGSTYILQVVGTGIVAPVVEELIYRGLLYGRMREFVSVVPAMLLSSAIFGICHGNLVQFVFAFGIGMILCLVYEKYQKIGMPIWMHIVVNLTSLILTWVSGSV